MNLTLRHKRIGKSRAETLTLWKQKPLRREKGRRCGVDSPSASACFLFFINRMRSRLLFCQVTNLENMFFLNKTKQSIKYFLVKCSTPHLRSSSVFFLFLHFWLPKRHRQTAKLTRAGHSRTPPDSPTEVLSFQSLDRGIREHFAPQHKSFSFSPFLFYFFIFFSLFFFLRGEVGEF